MAGARSGGSQPSGPQAAQASLMASSAAKPSSSGGSPTALLRWMVSLALAMPNSSVRNSVGQSLAVGIL